MNDNALLNHLPMPLCVCSMDRDPVVLLVNRQFVRLFGHTQQDIPTIAAWAKWVSADDSGDDIGFQRWLTAMARAAHASDKVESRDFRIGTRDGRVLNVMINAITATDRLLITAQDLSPWQNLQRELRITEARYRAAFQNSIDAIVITRLSTGEYLDLNHGFVDITGYERAEALGRTGLDLNLWVDPASRQCVIDQIREHQKLHNYEALLRRKNGELFWGLMAACQIEYEGETCLLSVTRDITERKRFEQQIQEARNAAEKANQRLQAANAKLKLLASTDALTGAANRRHFESAARGEMPRAARYGTPLSLVIFDIDHFKAINDRFGHPAGDKVLVALAERVRSRLRKVDVLGRWGGEEFTVLSPNCGVDAAMQLAEMLRVLIASEPFPEVGQVTCSFGVAELHALETFGMWLIRADRALYEAKAKGRNAISLGP
jgi:diguanylate cyclase (GGDEF)-like protein/PAS domain S-box-containing protein